MKGINDKFLILFEGGNLNESLHMNGLLIELPSQPAP